MNTCKPEENILFKHWETSFKLHFKWLVVCCHFSLHINLSVNLKKMPSQNVYGFIIKINPQIKTSLKDSHRSTAIHSEYTLIL